ncbi:hypothetical protein J663_2588 [Acinetobacter sp. 826659]|nr:hypothetical protein J663_2588 [Acinetobacter sp. 826659]
MYTEKYTNSHFYEKRVTHQSIDQNMRSIRQITLSLNLLQK